MRAPPGFRAQAGGFAALCWCHDNSLSFLDASAAEGRRPITAPLCVARTRWPHVSDHRLRSRVNAAAKASARSNIARLHLMETHDALGPLHRLDAVGVCPEREKIERRFEKGG